MAAINSRHKSLPFKSTSKCSMCLEEEEEKVVVVLFSDLACLITGQPFCRTVSEQYAVLEAHCYRSIGLFGFISSTVPDHSYTWLVCTLFCSFCFFLSPLNINSFPSNLILAAMPNVSLTSLSLFFFFGF